MLRCAECLFTLIAICHVRKLGDKDRSTWQGHDSCNQLLRIKEANDSSPEDCEAFEATNRYFKNKLGGLGQYYFGPHATGVGQITDREVLGISLATTGSADRRWQRHSPAAFQRMHHAMEASSLS